MPCLTPYVRMPHRLSIGCHTTQANYAIVWPMHIRQATQYLYLPHKYSGPQRTFTQCNTQTNERIEWMNERALSKRHNSTSILFFLFLHYHHFFIRFVIVRSFFLFFFFLLVFGRIMYSLVVCSLYQGNILLL